jgi:hypothetical protein
LSRAVKVTNQTLRADDRFRQELRDRIAQGHSDADARCALLTLSLQRNPANAEPACGIFPQKHHFSSAANAAPATRPACFCVQTDPGILQTRQSLATILFPFQLSKDGKTETLSLALSDSVSSSALIAELFYDFTKYRDYRRQRQPTGSSYSP